jgi:predicted nucleic acid-binding protein
MDLRDDGMLVFDTNILIDIEKGNKELKEQLLKQSLAYVGNPSITALTYAEFLFGYLSKRKEAIEQALEILNLYDILHTTKASAQLIAELQYSLEKKGTPLPLADVITAAIVLTHGATLVTRDNDFKKIEKIKLLLL